MNFLYTLGSLVFLSVFVLSLSKSIKNRKTLSPKISQTVLFIGIIYFILSTLSFLWFMDIIQYSSKDFLIIFSICTILQTIFVLRISRLIIGHKRIIYFSAIYAIISILTLIIFKSLAPVLILSIILFILLSLQFIFFDDNFMEVGLYGIVYSSSVIIIFILYLFKLIDSYFLAFTSILLLGFISKMFLSSVKTPTNSFPKEKEKPYFMIMLGHIVFVIVFINFVLIGTVVIHEFGHYGVAKLLGCESGKIIYENGLFYTEFLCEETSNTLYTTLGGILLPFLIALSLFFIGSKFVNETSILIAGFNLIAISRDIQSIGLSENISTLSTISGFILSIIGIIMLTKTKSAEIIYS